MASIMKIRDVCVTRLEDNADGSQSVRIDFPGKLDDESMQRILIYALYQVYDPDLVESDLKLGSAESAKTLV